MTRRLTSTWRNKASPPCKRPDQRKWSVHPHLTSKLYIYTHTHPLVYFTKTFEQWRLYVVNQACWSGPIVSVLPVQLQIKRKKQGGQRKRHFKTHNNHLAGVLEDYSEGVPVKKWNLVPSWEATEAPCPVTTQRLFHGSLWGLFPPPPFLCTPVSSGCVIHEVNSSCVVESCLVWLLISICRIRKGTDI